MIILEHVHLFCGLHLYLESDEAEEPTYYVTLEGDMVKELCPPTKDLSEATRVFRDTDEHYRGREEAETPEEKASYRQYQARA